MNHAQEAIKESREELRIFLDKYSYLLGALPAQDLSDMPKDLLHTFIDGIRSDIRERINDKLFFNNDPAPKEYQDGFKGGWEESIEEITAYLQELKENL